ncbi:acyltransferase family protein [Bradyrhizobium archetypum]|uniref:acyltransferase family protein n=1 Tax=Bradyrhizobium archetypum TaxID=2721160 RepID=UPI001F157CAD|nr:acyltransferase [Bradyrhizobium archetypum]
MPSIGSVLESKKGVGPGFDTLRIALAFSVIGWHSFHIAEGEPHPLGDLHFFWFPGYAVLSMFFALSGFLITASAIRLSLGNFILNRGLRIVPALLVEVVLSAIVLGAILTTLPLSEYFRSDGFWRYFGNVVGFVSLTLPGVFASNPDHSVNLSLWTIPFEIGCYVLIAGLILGKCLHGPRLVLILCAAFGATAIAIYLADPGFTSTSKLDWRNIFVGSGSRLFISFLLGIAIYLYRFEIEYSRRTACACLLFCLVVATVGPLPGALLNVLVTPALAYLTAYIGVSDLPKLPFFHRGDYSYGVYLYGYPIQQTIVAVWPSHINVAVLFVLAAFATTAFAMFSWHVIELPILRLRRRFSFVVGTRMQALEPAAGGTK